MSHQASKSTVNYTAPEPPKQPPIRIRQEQLHVLNTKAHQNQRLYFDMTQERLLERDLLCLTDKEVLKYNSNTEAYTEMDPQLRRFLKQTTSKGISSNCNNVCGLMTDGNLFVFKVKQKEVSVIKGVQNYQFMQSEELPSIYINDDASIILLKQVGIDYFWIWSIAKELQEQIKNQVQVQQVKETQKKSLFRSYSYDKRLPPDPTHPLNAPEQKNPQSNQSEIVRGSWFKAFLKDLGGPFQHRISQFSDGFDVRFVNSQYKFNECIKTVQTRIYTTEEYFGGNIKNTVPNEESVIIEINTYNFKVNYIEKGGHLFEQSQNIGTLKSKVSTLNFIGASSLKQKSVISKIDNSGQLCAIVLNSIHMVYCQLIFSNLDTQLSTTLQLFNFIETEDCPPFDNRGKTSLVIDDFQWTNSDAFLLLVFNSSSFAILPRLGSSLIQIFNPTLMNISQTMVDQFEQYKNPKAFNEIILPKPIQQKLQLSRLSFNQKKITMHPFEDAFIISEGQVCFVFRMEFEPELTDLFCKNNMSFYFLRFCISLDKLAIDPDILEKIPQLLTNKLPLFEFEKNAELDEEEEPGQVIMTASQINPFELGQRRMETNQSFNAEFTLESSQVLLNLKHLLMGLRWNKSQPLNYYQWLITVVNDTFFYFLKQSEPVYAFHALRMAESYCKKALYVTECEGDASLFESRSHEHRSSRVDVYDFKNLMSYFEVIHDIYDYHNTQEYMQKTTQEKIQLKFDLLSKMPSKLTRGSGNWRFQFQKNYALLVYYSLIQFRNYQASNFNILFLVFACYILQRYLDSMFLYHLQKMIEIVYRNFQMKKKSDDYEQFLGKSGKNFLIGPPEKMKVYQDWVQLAMKFTQSHLSSLYEQENVENVQDTILNELQGNHEKVNKNIGYLGEIGKLLQVTVQLKEEKYFDAINTIAEFDKFRQSEMNPCSLRHSNFRLGMSIYLFCETVQRNMFKSDSFEGINVEGLIQGIQRMSIATSSDHCTDFVQGNATIFEKLFKNMYKEKESRSSLSSLMASMNIQSETHFRQVLAILNFYINDITKGSLYLDKGVENKVFRILLLSISIKKSLKQLDILNDQLKEHEDHLFNSPTQIMHFQQRANCVQTVKKCLTLLKQYFYDFIADPLVHSPLSPSMGTPTKVYWTILTFMPSYANLIMKEEIGFKALSKLSDILKFVRLQSPIYRKNLVFQVIQNEGIVVEEEIQLQIKKFPLAFQILQEYLQLKDEQIWVQLQIILGKNKHMRNLLLNNLELMTMSMMCSTSGKSLIQFKERTLVLDSDVQYNDMYYSNDRGKNFVELLKNNIRKFSKVMNYLKTLSNYLVTEMEVQKEVSKMLLNQGKGQKIDQGLKNKYQLALLNLGQYEKRNKQLNRKVNQVSGEIGSNQVSSDEIKKKDKEDQLSELIDILNTKVKIKQLYRESERQIKHVKRELFLRCLKVQELFNLSFTTSLYFDKSIFDQRAGNILGVSDEILHSFKEILQKQEDKKKKQIEEEKEGILSFRGQNQIDSSRSGVGQNETPVKKNKQSEYGIVPSFDIAKVLMRGRQVGGQETPKGDNKHMSLIGKLKLLQESKNSSKASGISTKRNESIEFENRENVAGQVSNFAKRKNSVRRQFYVSEREENENNREDNRSAQVKKENGKGGGRNGVHKKNVMSLNPHGGGQQLAFQNQKTVESHQMQVSKDKNQSKAPPGLPKAKKTAKLSHRNQKDQLLKQIIQKKIQQTLQLAFDKLKDDIQIQNSHQLQQNQQSSQQAHDKQQQKTSASNQSFNLLFIKFEGDNYTVQNAKDMFKGGERPGKKSEVQFQGKSISGLVQGEGERQHEQRQIITQSQTEQIMRSKPFEIIRVGNESKGNAQVPKKGASSKQQQKPSKASKEQYQNFMLKFKQISEKIDKVQKEANQLNQDYSKYN